MIEESSDANDGNSSSYEELVSQSYYLVYNDFYTALIYFTNLNQKKFTAQEFRFKILLTFVKFLRITLIFRIRKFVFEILQFFLNIFY